MIFKVSLFMWLAIGPFGQKSLINTYSQIYFGKNDWCKKAQVELVVNPPEVEIKYTCKWREASCGGN